MGGQGSNGHCEFRPGYKTGSIKLFKKNIDHILKNIINSILLIRRDKGLRTGGECAVEKAIGKYDPLLGIINIDI